MNSASTADENRVRHEIVAAARAVSTRGLTHGSTGNISARIGERILVTPTGGSLGSVTAEDLSVIDVDGTHVAGRPPSKEAFLHAAILRARPQDTAVVHTHSAHAVAVSCMDGLDDADALPVLTAYYAMRVGSLPLVPYHPPGDRGLAAASARLAHDHRALLLAHHGPIVSGATVTAAVEAIEEIEQTARVFLLLTGHRMRTLSSTDAAALAPRS